jgi:hypothetical protein
MAGSAHFASHVCWQARRLERDITGKEALCGCFQAQHSVNEALSTYVEGAHRGMSEHTKTHVRRGSLPA